METSLLTDILVDAEQQVEHLVPAKYKSWADFLLSSEMITTYLFLITCLICYFILRRKYHSKKTHVEHNEQDEILEEIDKDRVKFIFLRNGLIIFVFIGLFLIWKEEIKTTFFSISFAIMAIVVAFKEMLLSITSSFIVKSFNIGDVIEFKGKVGTVIDRTMLTTRVMTKKDGLNTGQEFVIPNGNFLTNELTVLTKLGNYTTHFINVYVDHRRNY